MNAYLKKAFTLGPLRLNLSKSGLGLSFGVTGLRIGTGPKGPYIHAGRGGLYFRKSLKNKNEIIEDENIVIPDTPQSVWKKIYIGFANFAMLSFIFFIIMSAITIYFFIEFLKFAGSVKRGPKIKRKSKRKR